jgi:MFS family permease
MSMAVGAIYVLGTVISAILFPTAFSIISSFYAQMYSYTRASLAVGAIIFPSLVGLCVAQLFIHLWEKSRVSLELSRLRFFWGTAVVWLLASISALKISSTIGSTYFISFFTVAATLSLLLHHLYSLAGLLHGSVPCLVSASRYGPRRGKTHIDVSPENDGLAEEDVRQNETVNSRLNQTPTESSFLMTELLWLTLFLVQLFPISFVFEILAPLMELAIGALGAAVFGPLIGISVLLALLGFIPLSRRGGHYGKLCVIFFILALLTFVPITMYGRSAFNSDYPYVLEPRQVEDRIEVRSYMPYSVDIKSMVQVLDASLNWTCEKDNRLCSAPNAPHTFSSLSATCPESSSTVTLVLKTPGAWMHIITFGEVVPVKNIKLNGIEMKALERNFGIADFALDDKLRMQPFRFYLNSTEHTSSWHISFERDTSSFSQESPWRNNLNVTVESIWAESSSVPLVHRWMSEGKMPSWMSLVGLGMKGLASHSVTSYPCV